MSNAKAAVLCTLMVSCNSIPTPFWTNGMVGKSNYAGPIPETGQVYCARAAVTADNRAQSFLWTGWGLGLVSGLGVIAGNSMGTDPSVSATWLEKNRNTITLSAAALLAVPASLLLMRSQDQSAASAAFGLGLTKSNELALQHCLGVRAALADGRGAAAGLMLAPGSAGGTAGAREIGPDGTGGAGGIGAGRAGGTTPAGNPAAGAPEPKPR